MSSRFTVSSSNDEDTVAIVGQFDQDEASIRDVNAISSASPRGRESSELIPQVEVAGSAKKKKKRSPFKKYGSVFGTRGELMSILYDGSHRIGP